MSESERSKAETSTAVVRLNEPLRLESGRSLNGVELAYRTWGQLDADGKNGVLICHALTGSADADQWWSGLIGPGRALDPRHDYIVCSNVLGGCYGSTGPITEDPATREPYLGRFPDVTVRDMVVAQARLLEALGVRGLRIVIGGSLGGMQVLEWAALYPARVEAIVPVAVSARHSAWCIGLSEAQRQAIESDPKWRGGRYDPSDPPRHGLSVARMIAMCSYRSPGGFEQRFGRARTDGSFDVESYLRYQGSKLVDRFDPATYVTLTRAMDSHDVGRSRGGVESALRSVRQPALVVSIDSDVLYVPEEQRLLTELLPVGELLTISSPHGHDAFLIEVEALGRAVRKFRQRLG